MKYIAILICLIVSLEGNSQFDLSIGGGIDFISQSGFEDNKLVYNLELMVQRKIGKSKIGIGYRLTNNSYLHASNANVFVVEDNIQIFLDERGRINTKEVFLSAEYSIKSFILSTSIGIVNPTVITENEYFVKKNNNENIEDVEYEKKYVSNAFSRVSFGLGYDIKILDNLSIRPAFKLFLDLKPKSRIWDLASVDNYEAVYKELEGVKEFDSNSKTLIHENKYMFFNLALIYKL